MGSAYGTWVLLGIAAMPQTPALIFTAMWRLPVFEVFLALSWKAAEIRRLWLARRRVSNLG